MLNMYNILRHKSMYNIKCVDTNKMSSYRKEKTREVADHIFLS